MTLFVDHVLGLAMWLAIVTAEHPIVVAVAVLATLAAAVVVHKLVLRLEAWISRRVDEDRRRRAEAAIGAEVDRILADTFPLPRPMGHQIKRRRVAGVRVPGRPVRRRTRTSNSDRRH